MYTNIKIETGQVNLRNIFLYNSPFRTKFSHTVDNEQSFKIIKPFLLKASLSRVRPANIHNF